MNTALEALADERVAEAFPLQHDLLGLPAGQALDAAVKRKAGRPPGARNRRVEDAARYVVEHLGDPLVQLAAIATAPAKGLRGAAAPNEALETNSRDPARVGGG